MSSKLISLIEGFERLVANVTVRLDNKLGSTETAVAATKLSTARLINVTGDGSASVPFDGTADVSINLTLKNSGAAAGTYGSATTTPVVTVNAKGIVTNISTVTPRKTIVPVSAFELLPSTGEIDVIYMVKTSTNTALYRWNGAAYENMTRANSTTLTAERLETPRTFTFDGDASASVVFDGSANLTIPLVLSGTGVVAGTYNKVSVDAKGRVTAGYSLNAGDIPVLNQNTTGNAATASKLSNMRTITLTGDATGTGGFDGSSNLSLAVAVADNSHNHLPGNITGLDALLAAKADLNSAVLTGIPTGPTAPAGTNTKQLATTEFVRSEVIQAGVTKDGTGAEGTWDINITGGAGSLTTPRSISLTADATGSVLFDGSSNVLLVVNLKNSGVVAGVYGSNINSSTLTIDAAGRITTAVNTPIRTASLTQTGLVQLSSATNSTSNALAATAGALKAAYDLAAGAIPLSTKNAPNGVAGLNADNRVSESEDTMKLGGYTLAQVLAAAQSGTSDGALLAEEASRLETPRAIGLAGDATGTVDFDGSADVEVSVTLANSGVVAGSYGNNATIPTMTVDAKGRITTAGSVAIRTASTAQTGIVQLSSATGSTSQAQAATSAAVKAAYDLANAAIPSALMGVANGVAELDGTGVVKASQLPSYVDDVLEFADRAAFPPTGETAKIYVALDDNRIYRFTGTTYIEVSATTGNSDSASKLYTPRQIALQGDATGQVAFDGTANVSIAVVLANSGVTPGTYGKVTVDAKGRVTAGTSLVAADIPNLDTSKLTTGVIADARLNGIYTGVSITGNAATATKFQTARTINGVTFDGTANIVIADATKEPTILAGTTAQFWNGAKAWVDFATTVRATPVTGLSVASSANVVAADTLLVAIGKLQGQSTLKAPLASPALTGTPTAPTAVVSSDNTTIATTAFVNRAVDNLSATGNVATATKVVGTATVGSVAELVRGNMAASDAFRLAVGGSAVDAGWVEIATGDNGSEAIYARQYSGTAGGDPFQAIVNEAVILDTAGNTQFPGVVSAASFTGNATSASVLASVRTFTYTGDVTGSLAFNGSGNVSAAMTLSNSGVAAGTYGSVIGVPVIAVDTKGRVTSATTTTIRSATTAVTGVTQLNNTVNSTSTVQAATANAVKQAYDLANAAIPQSQLGVANGVATLGSDGFIPAGQLPSYVDDVLEFATLSVFPTTGETGKLYLALNNNRIYRWTGSVYMEISVGAGTADAATQLATARSIAATGDASWSVSFNGTGNVSSVLTLSNSGVTAGTYGKVTVDAKGRVTAGLALAAGDIPTLNQDTTGNATTATRLATARTLSYTGDVTGSLSFNGSANAAAAMTLANSGVTAGSYGKVTVDAKGRVTAGLSLVAADIPALDTSKIASGTLADARLSGTYTGVSITGNAATATKLATARTIAIAGAVTGSVAFDGTGNVSISTTLGAHTHTIAQVTGLQAELNSLLPLSGGTLTGPLTATAFTGNGAGLSALNASNLTTGTIDPARLPANMGGDTSGNAATATKVVGIAALGATTELVRGTMANSDGFRVAIGGGVNDAGWAEIATGDNGLEPIYVRQYNGVNGGDPFVTVVREIELLDAAGNTSFPGTVTASQFTGNADTASRLATARTLSYTGDVTGSLSFTGAANAAAAMTLANSGVTAGSYGKVTVDAKGRVTAGLSLVAADIPALDASKITTGLIADARLSGTYTGVNITGNAATATALATARSIAITGDATWSTSFNGTANVSAVLTLANSGVTAGSYGSVVAVPVMTVDAKGRVTAVTSTAIRPATTAVSGIVQLTAATNSTSATLAATASAVKSAYDLAASKISSSEKGAVNGVATLDANGTVPASQLPSYVDDVIEAATFAGLPATGETGKIYVTLNDDRIWRWSGTTYIEISVGGGTSDAATKLATARNIALTGAVTGSVNFDGSANVSISTTLAAHTHTVAQVTGLQALLDAKLATNGSGASLTALNASQLTAGTIPDARLTGSYTGLVNLTGSGSVDFAKFLGLATDTAAAPSFTWTGDTDTGFYRPVADQIAVSIGGVQRAVFSSAGIGGVGTNITGLNAANLASGIVPDARLSGTYTGVSITGNAATATKLATARTINGVAFDGTSNITITASTGAHTHAIADVTGLQAALDGKFSSAGGVTSGRVVALVNGQTSYDSAALESQSTTGDAMISLHCGGASAMAFVHPRGSNIIKITNSAGALAIMEAGTFVGGGFNLTGLNAAELGSGIVPDARLSGTYSGVNITGNAGTATTLQTARTINGVSFNGSANITVADSTKLPLTGGTLSGNVTAPSFYTAGWFRSTGPTGWYSEAYGGGINMEDTTWVRVYGNKAFLVSNTIAATGNVIGYYSDERLKENIRPIENALSDLKQLKGVRYNANALAASFGYDPTKQEVGFLAQDAKRVLPEVVELAPFDYSSEKGVSKSGEDYLTMDYGRVLPLAVNAVNELADIVEVDRKMLEGVMTTMAEMRKELDELRAVVKG